MDIKIIADDFTGANDLGTQLMKYNLLIKTLFENEKTASDIKIISTETRNLGEKEAYCKVNNIFKELKLEGIDKFYKKIDSTLRGNINAEIQAISDEIFDEKIFVVPSFPKAGRTLENGKHYLNEIPLNETEFSKDLVNPILENDLTRIIYNSELINLEDLKIGFKERIDKIEKKIIIIDAETDEDLKKIAKILVETKNDKYIVGSAGLMEYLPYYWKIKEEQVLILSGSSNQENVLKLDEFIKNKGNNFNILHLNLKNMPTIELKTKKDIIVLSCISEDYKIEIIENYMKKGMSIKEISDYISEYSAKIASKLIKKNNIKKIIVTGGETAYKLTKELKIKDMKLISKLENGVVFGKTDNGYLIITKPGGFGQEDIFEKMYEYLKNLNLN